MRAHIWRVRARAISARTLDQERPSAWQPDRCAVAWKARGKVCFVVAAEDMDPVGSGEGESALPTNCGV